MPKAVTLLSGTLLLCLFFSCTLMQPATVEKPVLKPNFDNSHAILIEKAVKGLDIVKAIKDYVDPKEKLIVVSMEKSLTYDFPVNYLFEDNLIGNLVNAKFAVLERDENLLSRILYEQGDRYQRVIPNSPSTILLEGIEDSGMKYFNPYTPARAVGENINPPAVNLKESLDVFSKLNEYYKDMLSQIQVKNADVLISYRVLECGIMVEKEEARKDTLRQDNNKATSNNRLKVHFKREAMARLAIRVVDAKTGEVRYAGILENRGNDVLSFEQEEGMMESDFLANVKEYQRYLENYHYTFYDQQLPNYRGTKQVQEEIRYQTQNNQQAFPLAGQNSEPGAQGVKK